jgi:hypothetical protein
MRTLLLLSVIGGCAAETGAPAADVCDEARAVVLECTGEEPAAPAEGCLGDYRETAATVVRDGCAALDTSGGKADGGGFWCWPVNRWLGMCRETPLAEAAAIPAIDEVCARRNDALCAHLRSGAWAEAVTTVYSRRQTERAEDVLRDPAVRLTVRDRAQALLVWNALTELGARPADPAGYPARADAFLREHFPAHDPASFPMARTLLPPRPADGCESPRAALLVFPGVVRLIDRREFDAQMAALAVAEPCLLTVRIETGSFVDPTINARQAEAAVARIRAEHGRIPLHLLGYSQGGRNVLQTLVDHPDIAADVRTVVTLNSAARGSQVADALYEVVRFIDEAPGCGWAEGPFKPLCTWAASQSAAPSDFLLGTIAFAMGIPLAELERFIAEEDGIAAAPDLTSFFRSHLPGIRSLTIEGGSGFYRDRAGELPRHVLYLSFRSVISDRNRNLPPSNALFYDLLRRAGDTEPHNDMQVLLTNQSLGGPIADLEIRSAVAEGNHWQWELVTGAVPENVMPAEMTDRIPQRALLVGYYQALAEVGLLHAD